MRLNNQGTVVSRTVDEHGTITVIEGGRAALTIRRTPHETLDQMFRRIVEHVQHVDPLDGPIPASVWKREPTTVFGLDIVVTYGAGAGFGVAIHRRNSETAVCSGHLSADQVTLDAAGELYGAELNRAIDILHGRRTA